MAKKRSKVWTIVLIAVLGLAAYGGYMAWQINKATENVRKVTDTVEKYATKENLAKAKQAAKDAKKATEGAAKSAKKKYSKIKSRWRILKDKANRAYKKGKKEWDKPLSTKREAIPKKKQIPVLTDKGLKWGNTDDFE